MTFYLAFKEIWRNRGRYILFSLVIALMTILVLFIAGLAEGLSLANREYLAKLDAELIVFQANVKLSTLTSRLDTQTLQEVRRLTGVADAGPVGFTSGAYVFPDGRADLNISLIGVVPGKPGSAPALSGRELISERAFEAVVDGNFVSRTRVRLGDTITLKTIQGTREELYQLKVVGISDGRQYFFQPSVFLPMAVWEKIRPQERAGISATDRTYNIIAVRLAEPASAKFMAGEIQQQVSRVEVVDRVTAYQATPGYQAQQSTLNTQRGFALLIGLLVIGGFFQIQTLQKVPNIGMLKAVGASNRTVGAAVVLQIMMITLFGVILGAFGTLLLSLGIPDVVPVRFTPETLAAALFSLLVIGPVGGLVSVYLALKVEPLIALGLSS